MATITKEIRPCMNAPIHIIILEDAGNGRKPQMFIRRFLARIREIVWDFLVAPDSNNSCAGIRQREWIGVFRHSNIDLNRAVFSCHGISADFFIGNATPWNSVSDVICSFTIGDYFTCGIL